MTTTRRYKSDSEYIGAMRRLIRAADDRLDNCELEQLGDLVDMDHELHELIAHVALALIDRGYTWGEIGAQVGTTKQAAQQKWGRQRIADSGNASAH